MEQDNKSSEALVQFLFAFDFALAPEEGLIFMIMNQLKISKQKARALFEKASFIWEARELLDQEIRVRSLDYDFERIGSVERSILRLSLFTLQDKEAKPTLVIKEAMRLAKKFSVPKAAKYVNAILDATPISEKQIS